MLRVSALVIVVFLLSVYGCTNKQAYYHAQSSQRLQCQKLPPQEYEMCLSQTQETYEEYERKRQELLETD
ncbi:MAG: hypothetical protein JKY66_08515 [Spongiibacteraceae bacterium]|nr:hypothetical protein [Spongiibacteraceae bacterium]